MGDLQLGPLAADVLRLINSLEGSFKETTLPLRWWAAYAGIHGRWGRSSALTFPGEGHRMTFGVNAASVSGRPPGYAGVAVAV